MAQILNEHDVAAGLSGSDKYWAYNALDCMITEEVRGVLAPRVAADPALSRTYNFELACQSPALTMMLRGVAFDEFACTKAIREWEAEEKKLTAQCCALIGPLWDLTDQRKGKCSDDKYHRWSNCVVEQRAEGYAPHSDCDARCIKCGVSRLIARAFNPLSAAQVIHLYIDILHLPPQHSRKGERGLTGDEEALEKLIHLQKTSESDAQILQNCILVKRAHKQIGFLKSARSCDGRLRSSVNVGATETGRWSASKDPFREGTNFQNIADRSRNVLVADPGLLLFYADLEQAESKIVAFDAMDQDYIDAHDSGDVHTFVAKMVWPELPWPGDPAGDREVADGKTPWDSEHSFRDYAKHVQHGGNIGQTPFGMSRDAHIPLAQAKEVYERMYGQAFPGVRRRQREIMAQVKETGILITPVGRKRQFFGRLWEPATQREGMAQTQQSTIADLLNVGLWRIWRELDTTVNILSAPHPRDDTKVWLLAQVHDAILGLIRPHDITTLQRVLALMRVPVLIRGQLCIVSTEVQLGQNFRKFNARKPETVGGLAKWKFDKRTGKIVVFNRREDLR